MKLSASLEYEKLREDRASWNIIYLNHDGKFFHAYDWSAWLIKMFVCTEALQKERGDSSMIQANRYQTKNSEYVIIGFPLESIGKYIPEYISMQPVEDGNGDLIIEIALPESINTMTYEEIKQQYEQWRSECPIKEQKQKTAGKGAPSNAQMATAKGGLFTILTQVLSWPVESKTPLENAEFIGELKRQLIALL